MGNYDDIDKLDDNKWCGWRWRSCLCKAFSLLMETYGIIFGTVQGLFGGIWLFEIRYRILNNDSDDYYGQNGYFQIICNEYTFGYMLESDVEICSVDIENWMIGFWMYLVI